MRRIAVEEAFTLPEIAAALRDVAKGPGIGLDEQLIQGIYDARPNSSGFGQMGFLEKLLDVDQRLQQMDELGIDMHLLSLTAPGVQIFRADRATMLAQLANDKLAEICASIQAASPA